MSRTSPPLSGTNRPDRRRLAAALVGAVALVAAVAVAGFAAAPAAATPPGIPHATTARAELEALPVAAEASMSGYSRDQFPHWTASGGCTTRQTVLERDGIDVATGAGCQPVSGRWYSPYDDVTVHTAGEVDVDHVVPLAEAWRSGAAAWSLDRRRAFANDLGGPQLRAVSATANRAKGDQDPASWQPRSAYRCTYAKMWVRTKHRWSLTAQAAEKSALRSMLDTC